MNMCGTRSHPWWTRKNLYWQLSREGNGHDLGINMTHQPPEDAPAGHTGGQTLPWTSEEELDNDILECTILSMPQLLSTAADREGWRRITAAASHMSPG